METLLQDIRYGIRMMRKTPAATVVAILTLALGIGAAAAGFTLIDAVLLNPLPFKEPDRLVEIWEDFSATPIGRERPAKMPAPPAHIIDWQERCRSFERIAAVCSAWPAPVLTGGDVPEPLTGLNVSASLFPMLGVRPLVGRTFTSEEDAAAAQPVVVLSYGFWQRHFGGDTGVVGKTIFLNGRGRTVVGVLPAAFAVPLRGDADLWLPLGWSAAARDDHGAFNYTILARLKHGTTLEQAQADLAASTQRIAPCLDQEWFRGLAIRANPLHESIIGNARPALFVVMGAAVCVFLISWVNIATLLLARGTARGREVAIRSAVGATSGRLARQSLTESLLLTITAGLLGVLIAYVAVPIGIHAMPSELPRADEVDVDARVLGFALLVSVAAGVLFGLVPVSRSAGTKLGEALKEGGTTGDTGTGPQRIQHTLVAIEVAMALLVLAGASLMTLSWLRLSAVDPGFAPDNVLVLDVTLPRPQSAFLSDKILAGVTGLPGVVAAAFTTAAPFRVGQNVYDAWFAEEAQTPAPGAVPDVKESTVTPGYFKTLGIPLKKGRLFTDNDSEEALKVAVINETLARRLFGAVDPVGRRVMQPAIGLGKLSPRLRSELRAQYGVGEEVETIERPTYTVIGIIRDVKQKGPDIEVEPEIYFTPHQHPEYLTTLVVRAARHPIALSAAVRKQVAQVIPDTPVTAVTTMKQVVRSHSARQQFAAALGVAFTVIALILAAVGTYGVMAYWVARHRHELGIRMAVGAKPIEILRYVLLRGMRLVFIGSVFGAFGGYAVNRILVNRLYVYKVGPGDLSVFAAAILMLGAVTFLACYVNARKATKVDPTVVLRQE